MAVRPVAAAFPAGSESHEAGGARYTLTVLRGADLAQLAPFYRATFGRREFAADWLARKYACSFGGVEAFSCVAFDERGEPAGAFGILPAPIRFGDRLEVGGQPVDAATGAAHRRRGLFVRLAEMARETCEAVGISFLYAFPHPAGGSYPGFVNRLGYSHIDDLLEHRLSVRTPPVERIARRTPGIRRLYDGYADHVVARRRARDGVLGNSLLADGFAAVDRDPALHRYKERFAGSSVLAVPGGRIWARRGGALYLGDLEAATEADATRCADSLHGLARRLGIARVVFQASRETRFTTLLRARFRQGPGLAVVYRDLSSEIPHERLRFTFGDLDNF